MDLSKFFGFDDAPMTQIITATTEALGQMRAENNNVQHINGSLQLANISTSGTVLASRINDWSMDYGRIQARLEELLGRVEAIRKLNVDKTYETTQASQHGNG